MPLMHCPPGAALYTLHSLSYHDSGEGLVHVAEAHVPEALGAGWRLAEQQKVEVLTDACSEEAGSSQPPEEAEETWPDDEVAGAAAPGSPEPAEGSETASLSPPRETTSRSDAQTMSHRDRYHDRQRYRHGR